MSYFAKILLCKIVRKLAKNIHFLWVPQFVFDYLRFWIISVLFCLIYR